MIERDKSTIEFIRAVLRPMLIILMGLGTFTFIVNNIDSEFAQWWMRLFYAGAAEWIVERPALKALKGIKGGS